LLVWVRQEYYQGKHKNDNPGRKWTKTEV